MFLVDLSASKSFGTRVRTKSDLAVELCTVLAFAAARNSDRVGALFVTDQVEKFIAPRQGRRQALRVVSELLAFEPAGRGTDLVAGLEHLEPILRRRSVLFIVSDFLTAGYDLALSRAARRHDVSALQLHDPRERELPSAGLMTLWDPESGEWHYVDTKSREVREHFERRSQAFDADLEHTLRRSDIDLVRLETGRSYAEPLLAFFRQRERRLWR
jgi:uncharacterized protein (DUF58 family)